MTIIKTTPREDNFHDIQSQSHRRAPWLPGYIEVPPHLESAAWASCGYCDLTIEDGVLVAITPTEPPTPEPEPIPAPTPSEQMRADIDFLAAMAGVTL